MCRTSSAHAQLTAIIGALSLMHASVAHDVTATAAERMTESNATQALIARTTQKHKPKLEKMQMRRAPQLKNRPNPHMATKSKLFDADLIFLKDVERAEKHFTTSPAARKILARLHGSEVRVRLVYGKESNWQKGWGGDAKISWDHKTYLESHDLAHQQIPGACGINSAALILLHEIYHADWAITNPVGLAILHVMPHPLYDNLEEARVVQLTNKAALQLNETVRESHRGEYHPAEHFLDRNGGICLDRPHAPEKSELQVLAETDTANNTDSLSVSEDNRARVLKILKDREPAVDPSLMRELQELFYQHGKIGQELKQTPDQPDSARTIEQAYREDIKRAITFAGKFELSLDG